VVQEVLYVLTRRGQREAGVQLARSMTEAFPSLLPVTREDLILACEILERYPDLLARDAVHIATMQNNGIGMIISADRHFDGIDGISRVDPSEM
jgi:predicted nucleic acid-binding protein